MKYFRPLHCHVTRRRTRGLQRGLWKQTLAKRSDTSPTMCKVSSLIGRSRGEYRHILRGCGRRIMYWYNK